MVGYPCREIETKWQAYWQTNKTFAIGRDLDRGPESKRLKRRGEVVVDRLGHADDRQAPLVKQPRERVCAVAG